MNLMQHCFANPDVEPRKPSRYRNEKLVTLVTEVITVRVKPVRVKLDKIVSCQWLNPVIDIKKIFFQMRPRGLK